MNNIKRAWVSLAAAGALLAPCWAASGLSAEGAPIAVFAEVDGAVISVEEFNGALTAAIRQKFYHRQPREDQLDALRREVTERLVNRLLLLNEAGRRGIQPDDAKVGAEIAAYEQRNRDRPQWAESRARVLPALKRALQEQDVIAQLEAAARAAPPPAEAELRAYYGSHPESFTEPERFRLSMILLKVDPSAPDAAWEEALERAQDLVKQLAGGADFAGLAMRNSGDASAKDGGDLGYRHRGMLPRGIENEVDKLALGAASEPIRLLEGVAIFRVVERRAAQLRSLEEVRRSAAELWAREQGETQWRQLIARLRAGAGIRIGGEPPPSVAIEGGMAGGQTAR